MSLTGGVGDAEIAYNALLEAQANCEFWMGWKIYFTDIHSPAGIRDRANWRFQPRINNIHNWVKASHEIQDDPDIPGVNSLITDERGQEILNQGSSQFGLTTKFKSFKFTPIPLP